MEKREYDTGGRGVLQGVVQHGVSCGYALIMDVQLILWTQFAFIHFSMPSV